MHLDELGIQIHTVCVQLMCIPGIQLKEAMVQAVFTAVFPNSDQISDKDGEQ